MRRAVTIMGTRLVFFGTIIPAMIILITTLIAAIHPRLQGILIMTWGLRFLFWPCY
jgi:hypothetical protein